MNNKGINLLETLITLAIFSIMVLAVIPLFQSFQFNRELNTEAFKIIRVLRRAQSMAMNGRADSDFGVYFLSGSYTLFKGNDYAGRDANYDENFDIASSINLSTNFGNEIYFHKITGNASKVGAITLTSDSGETVDIIINSEGLVQINR